jgi:PKD repeat protein
VEDGAGPQGSVGATCHLGSATSASCGLSSAAMAKLRHLEAPEGAQIAGPSSPPLTWYNLSYLGLYNSGPVGYFASMAYDPLVDQVVYFGGCAATDCYTNTTWIYSGFYWFNETSYFSFSPGGREGAGMDFDPALGGIVLFGGGNSTHTYNDTWLYDGSWNNISGSVGAPPSARAFGSLAWDPAEDGILVVDGCTSAACLGGISDTWLLGNGGWANLGVSPGGSGNALGYTSMAFDAYDGYMLFYGGYDGNTSVNYTYTFSAGVWTNISMHDSGCAFGCNLPPPGRAIAALTWDSELDAVVMLGGLNFSTFTVYNDSWVFYVGGWYPLISPGFTEPPATFYPTFGQAVAPNNTGVTPNFVGGLCFVGNCSGDEWVFENADWMRNVTVSPSPVDDNATVSIVANGSLEYGSGPFQSVDVDLGNGYSLGSLLLWNETSNWSAPLNASYKTSAPGNYTMTVYAIDYWGIYGNDWKVNISVGTNLTAPAFSAPAHLEAGSAAAFSDSGGQHGTQPYAYGWSFGDGGIGNGPSVHHTFAAAGHYLVSLNVTDSGGGFVLENRTLTVLAGVSVASSATLLGVDVGVADQFTGSGSGGSGTFSTYAWTFGDGAGSSNASASHAYSATGNFTARLNVTDSYGFQGNHSLKITVNPALAASPTGSSSATTSAAVPFTAGASAGTAPYSYSWLFGDGGTSNLANQSHLYASAGTYTVTLWVNDSGGGSVKKSWSVTVAAGTSKTPSGNSSGTSFPWWIVIVVIVVLALAGIGGFLFMRSRRPPAATTPPTPRTPPPAPTPWTEGAPANPPSSPPSGGPPPGALG